MLAGAFLHEGLERMIDASGFAEITQIRPKLGVGSADIDTAVDAQSPVLYFAYE